MKKTIVWLLAVTSIIFSLQMSVFAHSGRTDSSGGHRNHSTGEYHYHHGYSAHDHYDVDGDWDKDCPYRYNEETDYTPWYKRDVCVFFIFIGVAVVLLFLCRFVRLLLDNRDRVCEVLSYIFTFEWADDVADWFDCIPIIGSIIGMLFRIVFGVALIGAVIVGGACGVGMLYKAVPGLTTVLMGLAAISVCLWRFVKWILDKWN